MRKKAVAILILLICSSNAFAVRPYCVAHRGNSSVEFENSLSSIQSALDINVGGIEFDVHHTKDGIAVVNHDETLKRTVRNNGRCPIETPIAELDYSQIENNCLLLNGEKIPLLEEVLELFKGHSSRVVLEYKGPSQKSDVLLLKKFMEESQNEIIIISFNVNYLKNLETWTGSRLNSQKISYLQLKKYMSSQDNGLDGMVSKYMRKKQVSDLHRRGKIVGAYTKDTPSKIKKYLKKGVDYITTNSPLVCQSVIEQMFPQK